MVMPRPAVAQTEPRGESAPAIEDRESRPLGRPPAKGERSEVFGLGGSGGDRGSSLWNNPLLRTGGSLAVVLGLIYGLARVAKRVNGNGSALASAFGGGGAAPAGVIEVLGRYPLGRGQTLILLRIDNRVLLLAQSTPGFRLRGGGGAGTLTTLCEMSDAEDVASILLKVQDAEQASTAAKFGELLGRFDARHAEAGGGVVEVGAGGRKTRAGAGGDRAELWDAASLVPGAASGGGGGGGGDGALRERLKAIRSGVGGRGGGR
jgi:flagellar biogenesis protein FliO